MFLIVWLAAASAATVHVVESSEDWSALAPTSGDIVLLKGPTTIEISHTFTEDVVVVPASPGLAITGSFTVEAEVALHGLKLTSESTPLIVNTGSLTLWGMEVHEGASASVGGCVSVSKGTLEVHNSLFTGCHADTGGAIYLASNTNLVLDQSTFLHNEADTSGGAISASGIAEISQTTFEDNTASALYCGHQCVVKSSHFLDNTGKTGAGILNKGDSLLIQDSHFCGNLATTGGAVYSEGTASLANSLFVRNQADTGGAFYQAQTNDPKADTPSLSHSSLIGNIASTAPGVFTAQDLFLTEDLFAYQQASAPDSTYVIEAEGPVTAPSPSYMENHLYPAAPPLLDPQSDPNDLRSRLTETAPPYPEPSDCTPDPQHTQPLLGVQGFPEDQDGDGVFASVDCDDADPLVGLGVLTYADADADGHGDPWAPEVTCTPPGSPLPPDDCDDSDAHTYLGAQERCDGQDNNCDGQTDEGSHTFYPDEDGDGEGAGDPTLRSDCSPPSGQVENDLDCDDTDPQVHTGATELCDGIDNNCDLQIDEGCAATTTTTTTEVIPGATEPPQGCSCGPSRGPLGALWLLPAWLLMRRRCSS